MSVGVAEEPAETPLGSGQQPACTEDGSWLLETRVRDDRDLRGWLLGLVAAVSDGAGIAARAREGAEPCVRHLVASIAIALAQDPQSEPTTAALRPLRAAGYEVSAVRDLAPGVPDETVIAMAAQENRVLLTED